MVDAQPREDQGSHRQASKLGNGWRKRIGWPFVEDSARTAVAAVASLLLARLFRLPEGYWAAVTAIIVMQSSLGSALTISAQRLAGTALGTTTAVVLKTYFGSGVAAFGLAIFAMGLICMVLGLERNAYRFAGITLTIVTLVGYTQPPWVIAAHRFAEVSLGIVVGVGLAALWPPLYPLP
jgi:uncharacterized membrane protein YccC